MHKQPKRKRQKVKGFKRSKNSEFSLNKKISISFSILFFIYTALLIGFFNPERLFVIPMFLVSVSAGIFFLLTNFMKIRRSLFVSLFVGIALTLYIYVVFTVFQFIPLLLFFILLDRYFERH